MRAAPRMGWLSDELSDDWEVEAQISRAAPRTQYPITICAGWRVVADDLQWILQHWRAPDWRSRSYCRTRSGLELAIRENIGEPYQSAVAHFPDWHPDVAEAPDPVMRAAAPVGVVCSPEPVRVEAPAPLPPLTADNHPLEFYPDGYPIMPEFLRRACSSASTVTVSKKEM